MEHAVSHQKETHVGPRLHVGLMPFCQTGLSWGGNVWLEPYHQIFCRDLELRRDGRGSGPNDLD
jgi:hypothetical protein